MTLLDDDARQFISALDDLGCAIWVGHPQGDGKGEFWRPKGWPQADPKENSSRLAGFEPGRCLCVNTGRVLVVVDVDPRNGGDIQAVRKLLDELRVRVFAEVTTPSGGRHFYVDGGHHDMPSVHSKLPGLPGVDLQAAGANVYLPGTLRPKYDGKGYRIVANDLDALRTEGDAEGAAALSKWVADHVPGRSGNGPSGQPWDGTPPTPRQQRYLTKMLDQNAKSLEKAPRGQRNETLYRAALRCASFVAGAGLDQQRVQERLTTAAIECGLADDDGLEAVEATIASAFTVGLATPIAVPDPQGEGENDIELASNRGGDGGTALDSAPCPSVEIRNGVELLDELLETLIRYVRFPDDHAADAVALWIAATHGIACWNAAPRLVLNSPQKRCGKTRALDVISGLCHEPLITVNATSAAIYRSLGHEQPPTLVIDEADAIFGSKRAAEQNEDLRARTRPRANPRPVLG